MKLSLIAPAAVMALTLVAGTASADQAPAPPAPAAPTPAAQAPAAALAAPESAPPAPAATPLTTRPSHPLQTAPTHEGTPWGYKLLAGVGVAAAAGLWLHNKRKAKPPASKKSTKIDVMARTSVGVRSDLLVVDVEGMRLLVGLTPASIQTLAVLETPPEPADAKDAEVDNVNEIVKISPESRSIAASPDVIELGDRVRSLLGPQRLGRAASVDTDSEDEPEIAPAPVRPRRTPSPKAAPKTAAKRARVAGQAKGLLLAMEDGEAVGAAKDSKKRSDPPIRLGDW